MISENRDDEGGVSLMDAYWAHGENRFRVSDR